MIQLSNKALLMIEPEGTDVSETPLIDSLARRVTAALRKCTTGAAWMGWHSCVCGAVSGCEDLYTEAGLLTNSLAVHYMVWHRTEIPREELLKVLLLPPEYEEPFPYELVEPKRKGLAFQACLEAQRQIQRRQYNTRFDTAWRGDTGPKFYDISTVYAPCVPSVPGKKGGQK